MQLYYEGTQLMTDNELEMFIEMQKAISRIEANQVNHLQYLEAVNENSKEAKKELEGRIDFVSTALRAHAEVEDAHGGRGHKRAWDTIFQVIGALGVMAGIIIGLLKIWRG